MRVRNVHRRAIDDADRVGGLLNGLASESDGLWPRDRWPAMRLDRQLQVGARGGHGPIRYRVEVFEPCRLVRFRFERPRGFEGYHEFHLVQGDRAELVHVLEVRLTGVARLSWPLVYRPLHDDLIEDALANAASNVTPAKWSPAKWSPATRFLRWLMSSGSRAR